MELKKDKRIGKVLFIVEGGKHEFSLIKRIFSDILGYRRIEKRRNQATFYESQTDSHSEVAVINTKTSNIGSINEQEYLEAIYTELIEKFSFDVTNAAIYYIFDRDPESNTDINLITDLIKTLKNSRENDNNLQGGILILSYPSIEAYEVSNFVKESYKIYKKTGSDVKEYISQNAKDISMNKISETTIVHAYMEMEQCIKELLGKDIDIDNFFNINMDVFDMEEQHFEKSHTYFLLSIMSYILLDLGILQE
ncbi:MAG: hypothetical protein J1E98_14865 [Lachnospiraceae bacterium]|nr:hypothetical protein [Lachnospiraceae bacterium]